MFMTIQACTLHFDALAGISSTNSFSDSFTARPELTSETKVVW